MQKSKETTKEGFGNVASARPLISVIKILLLTGIRSQYGATVYSLSLYSIFVGHPSKELSLVLASTCSTCLPLMGILLAQSKGVLFVG